MAKYSLDTLTSIFLPKNIRKTRDNLPESKVTLVPHADAISLYHVVKDIMEYLNITPGSGTTDITVTPNSSSVLISSSSGADATLASATTSLAGAMSAADKTNLGALITLSGVGFASTNLGTFTGAIIPDSSTIKAALQALESAFQASPPYSTEQVQDDIGTILVDSSTIDFTYLDAVPSISADVKNASITYSKIQDVTSGKLLGRYSLTTGSPQEISVGSSLLLHSGTLDHADTSSVTNSTNSGATVLQSITFDTYGHVQTVTTKTLSVADFGGVDGSGGANRVAYWLDSNTLTSDSDFTFNGSGLAVNTTLAAGHVLTVGGAAKAATITAEGTGTLGSTLGAAELRVSNTTPSTGQIWYVNSANNGNLLIASSAINPELTIDTNGNVLVENLLKVGDTTGAATHIMGRDSSGYLRTITIGSGLVLSSGTLSSSGGGGGGGYATIEEDGTMLTPYTILNFVGSAFTAADDVPNTRTNVTLHSNLETLAGLTLVDGDFLYYNSSAVRKLTPVKNTQAVSSGTTVTLPYTPAANTIVDVYRNGILQEVTTEYTISGATLTFTTAFISDEKVTTKFYK